MDRGNGAGGNEGETGLCQGWEAEAAQRTSGGFQGGERLTCMSKLKNGLCWGTEAKLGEGGRCEEKSMITRG